MNKNTKVISIAAVSGGGKTTVTERLTNELKNSKALYFDSYNFDNCPADICKWIDDGANCRTKRSLYSKRRATLYYRCC